MKRPAISLSLGILVTILAAGLVLMPGCRDDGAGFDYAAILKHYFHGVDIYKIYQ